MSRFSLNSILLGALMCAPAVVHLAPQQADATVMKALSLDQMVKQSDVIVRGEVVAQHSAWNEAGNRIYTVTELKVMEPLKGQATSETIIKIRQLGGTVDGITQNIAGNALLSTGEEVAIFLRADAEKSLHYVVGMAQGKYTIDRSSGTPMVVRQMHGLSFTRPGVKTLADAPKPTGKTTSWADLKAQITAAQAPPR
ncbi:MAG: hypothetical protein ACE366_09375 [Bradymonadia bacterium]